jgi:hypothetical protein
MSLDFTSRFGPLRRVSCPFCLERFAARAMPLQCRNPGCKTHSTRLMEDLVATTALRGRQGGRRGKAVAPGPWSIDPRFDTRRGMRRHFDWLVLPDSLECPHCGEAAAVRLCPRCYRRLPDSVLRYRPAHVATVGPRSVGKTTYLTVAIHELDQRVGVEEGFALEPLDGDVRERYERGYHGPTFGKPGHGPSRTGNGVARRRSHAPTPGFAVDRQILQPMVFRLVWGYGRRRRGALCSFFDMSGADWECDTESLRSEAQYLTHAAALLLVIDPLRIAAVADDPRVVLTEAESRVPTSDPLREIRKLAEFFPKNPVKVPLAVCLTKLDRWGRLLPRETMLHEWSLGIATGPPSAGLDRTIHEEVQAALQRWGESGMVEQVAASFPNHRFFACSALGDAAQAREDLPQPLPTPLLVERPVLWLLKRQGAV